MFRIHLSASALALTLGVSTATAITFTGTNGNQGASATFDINGTTLTVTLAGTTGDVLNPAGVLTTVFFTLGGAPLTPVSALVGPTSSGKNGAPGANANVGGEWVYATGFSQYGANSGISTTGLNLFSGAKGGNFNGLDLDNEGNGSIAYGLLTEDDNFATGNSPVKNGGAPLVQSSIVFTLSGVASNAVVSNVTFQWGTSLTEPSAPGVPGGGPTIPDSGSTLALAGIALLTLAASRRLASQEN